MTLFVFDKPVLRAPDDQDWSDLTASVQTGPASWVNDPVTGEPTGLEIPFNPDPSPAEQDRIILRLTTASLNEETLRLRADAAIASNTTWRTNTYPQVVSGADSIINSPTATAREKNLAQGIKTLANKMDDLCAQNNALIRIELRRYEATT